MSIIRGFVKGGSWLTLASVASKLVSVLTIPLLARALGPEALGIYSIIFVLTQSAQSFSSVGADVAMQRDGARYELLGATKVGNIFGVGLSLICLASVIVAMLIACYRSFLAQHWLGQPSVVPWLGLAAIVIGLQPFGAVPLTFLSSLKDFRAYAIRSTLGHVVTNLLTVILGYGFGLYGALLGLVFSAMMQIFWSFLIVRPVLSAKGIVLRLDNYVREAKSILKLGLPYYFGHTLLGSVAGLPLMGLVSQYGGLQDLGYLRISESLAALLGFIPTAIAPATITYLSSSMAQSTEAYQSFKSMHLRGLWITLLLPTILVSLSASPLIYFLYGEAYESANLLSSIYVWMFLASTITSCLIQYLVVIGKTFRVGIASTLGVATWIITAFYLIPMPSMGAKGYLISQFIGQIVGLVLVWQPAVRDLHVYDKKRLKIVSVMTISICTLSLGIAYQGFDSILQQISASLAGCIFCLVLFFQITYATERNKLKSIILNLAKSPAL